MLFLNSLLVPVVLKVLFKTSLSFALVSVEARERDVRFAFGTTQSQA